MSTSTNREIKVPTHRPSDQLLKIIAYVGAPCLTLSFTMEKYQSPKWIIATTGVLFLFGWICSILFIRRYKLAGASLLANILTYVLLISLLLAAISNILALIPGFPTAYFYLFDLFWPISNVLLLVLTISIAFSGALKGWRKYLPLVAGCWLPVAMIINLHAANNRWLNYLVEVHATIGWLLLILAISFKNRTQQLLV
ncbi:MAG: hypothetical protein MUE38_05410 [Flavihumibacter sp.]|nr:hypothetical protein [Flavihumibacter sp.]